MKLLGRIIVGIVACLALMLVVLRITGFDPGGPKKAGDDWNAHNRPGLWLAGTVSNAKIDDWSFTDDMPTIEVQTHTWYGLPHSTIVACNVYKGNLYIISLYQAGHGEHFWNKNVDSDPRVRLKVGDQLYDRTLFEVFNPVELTGALVSRAKKYGPEHPLYLHPHNISVTDPYSVIDPYSILKIYRVMD